MGTLTPYTRCTGTLVGSLSRTKGSRYHGVYTTSQWILFHDSPIHPFPNYTSAPLRTVVAHPAGAHAGFLYCRE